MNDIRLKFEEIWPVPEGVYWKSETSAYWTNNHTYEYSMDEWNSRLDTFTRCQETTAIYLTTIEELTTELECAAIHYVHDSIGYASAIGCVNRAKKIMESLK